MKSKLRIPAMFLLMLPWITPSFSQETSPQTADANRTKQMLAVSLLRTINTLEVTYKYGHGGKYAAWDELLGSTEFGASKVATNMSRIDPRLGNAQFATGSEILPGWSLRLNVAADGQKYDLMLRAEKDDCGYAAVTNESGVIWQAKSIDCPI